MPNGEIKVNNKFLEKERKQLNNKNKILKIANYKIF